MKPYSPLIVAGLCLLMISPATAETAGDKLQNTLSKIVAVDSSTVTASSTSTSSSSSTTSVSRANRVKDQLKNIDKTRAGLRKARKKRVSDARKARKLYYHGGDQTTSSTAKS